MMLRLRRICNKFFNCFIAFLGLFQLEFEFMLIEIMRDYLECYVL